jgi:hypothetical protein
MNKLLLMLFTVGSLLMAATWENAVVNSIKVEGDRFTGYIAGFNGSGSSYGMCWGLAPKNATSISTTTLQILGFKDEASATEKGVGQLGSSVILIGAHSTFYGKEGILPFWGIRSYNLKKTGLYLGIASYELNNITSKHINLGYDFALEQWGLDFVFMF